jgi:hypothetical protein
LRDVFDNEFGNGILAVKEEQTGNAFLSPPVIKKA